jgi:hypothetical protein
MKLLLEAWKGYLASTKPISQQNANYPEEEEDVYGGQEEETLQDIETKYFGKDETQLQKICNTLVVSYRQNPYDAFQLQRFATALGKNENLKIEYMGSGAFRSTYAIGNDLVLKITNDPSDPDNLKMNENDYDLGTDSSIGNVVPRAFYHGKKFEWVLLERVTPITKNYEAAKFFQTDLLPPVEMLSESERNDYFNLVMLCLEEKNEKYYKSLLRFSKNIKDRFQPNQSIPTFTELRQHLLRTHPTFRNLYKAVKRYDIETSEIRYNNIGYGSDNRFVLLDSSIF